MKSPKFCIGDVVKITSSSQHGGGGKIWAIYEARRYFINAPYDKRLALEDAWSKVDKEWKEKYIYFLALEKPVRAVTYEEFVQMNCLEFNKENFDLYERSYQPVYDISGPEEDLVLIKEAQYSYV